jgi:uncharacterized protein (TIGR03790 family)
MVRLPILKRASILLFAALFPLGSRAQAVQSGASVVVVYNSAMPGSKEVAEHYAAKRNVPSGQVTGLDLPVAEIMTRQEYRERLQQPLLKFLETGGFFVFDDPAAKGESAPSRRLRKAAVRYLVLCYGVPLRIAEDPQLTEQGQEKVPEAFRRNGAAVDSELAILPLSYTKVMMTGPVVNPFFGTTNAAALNPQNGILLVARLDGPDVNVARELVDKAMEAEKDGLWGRAYFDMRGLTDGPYLKGDQSIAAAAKVASELGFETVVDDRPETFTAGFPMSHIALYAGWYDANASGPFSLPHVEFMPGAFAYHLHSYSAPSLRTTNHNWCGPLLARGATATMGCVDEPYLECTPNMQLFFSRWLLDGFSFGEAAWACQSALSWQSTVIGDPLYQPLKTRPQVHHEQLVAQHSRLAEWSHLRWVDLNLAAGGSKADAIRYLQHEPMTASSAVLAEKLGDLYESTGKTHSAIAEYQKALKLDPSPQQSVRLTLEIGDKLISENKQGEALRVFDAFLKSSPNYPDAAALYRRMETLARKLGKDSDAAVYSTQVRRLTMGE